MKRKTYVKRMLEEVMLYNKLVQDQYTDFRLYEYEGIDVLNITNGVSKYEGGLWLYIEFNKCPKAELEAELTDLRSYILKDLMDG